MADCGFHFFLVESHRMQDVWDPPPADSASTMPFIHFVVPEYKLVTRKLTWGEDRVFY